ncbi:hypothetical protein GCM10028862_16750 [Luteimonas pelagia]
MKLATLLMKGNSLSHLYKTAAWKRTRANQLQVEPLCRYCREMGRMTPASVADHIEPHRGDELAFWNNPLQSLCASCHSGPKQREERTGVRLGCDVHGNPLGRDDW